MSKGEPKTALTPDLERGGTEVLPGKPIFPKASEYLDAVKKTSKQAGRHDTCAEAQLDAVWLDLLGADGTNDVQKGLPEGNADQLVSADPLNAQAREPEVSITIADGARPTSVLPILIKGSQPSNLESTNAPSALENIETSSAVVLS